MKLEEFNHPFSYYAINNYPIDVKFNMYII